MISDRGASRASKPLPESNMDDLLLGRTRELVGGGEVERNWRGVLIALLVILVVLSLILLFTVLLTPPDRAPKLRGPKISLHNLTRGILSSPPKNNASWISENEIVFMDTLGGISLLNVENSTVKRIMSNSSFRQVNAVEFQISGDLKYALLLSDVRKVFSNTREALYYVCEIATQTRTRLGEGPVSRAVWSGSALAYVERGDLYFLPAPRSQPIRITDTASDDVTNAFPDWIYQEEVFRDDLAMWFSPEGGHLAFVVFNDTEVGRVSFTSYADGQTYPSMRFIHYPKAGTTNPRVTLCVLNLTEASLNQFERIEQPTTVSPDGTPAYLTTVHWVTETQLMAIWVNRRQNLTLYSNCTAPGWNCTDSFKQSAVEGSVPLKPGIVTSPQGETFVSRLPVLDGANGEYLQAVKVPQEAQPVPLTQGQLHVCELLAWDTESRILYLEAAPPGKPTQRHLYRYDMSQETLDCMTCPFYNCTNNTSCRAPANDSLGDSSPIRTKDCLYVKATFSPRSYKFFILECLGPQVPSVHVMDAQTNTKIVTLQPNSLLRETYDSMAVPQIKLFQVAIEGGFNAQVKLQLPPGFRDYEDMIFPLILRVSFKPGEQKVDYRWSVDYASYLSSSNYIVAEVEGRGAENAGLELLNAAHLKLGRIDASDQIAVIKYLQENLKFVDRDKMGVFGSGYGGYLAGMILAQDTDLFRCGLSISGIYSWPHYNSVWTERWLATSNVTDNYRGYEDSDLTRRAGNLGNKSLLVIHGTADHISHYQHAMLLTRALVQEGVLFKHVSYADEGHYLEGVLHHLYTSLDAYWTECLSPPDLTEWELASPSFLFNT